MRHSNVCTNIFVLILFSLQLLTLFANHVRTSQNRSSHELYQSFILQQHGKALREVAHIIKDVDVDEMQNFNDLDYYVNQIASEAIPFLSTRGISLVDIIVANEKRSGFTVCITTGEHQLDKLRVLLHNIFDVHQSKLLVEVFYGGDSDFPPDKRLALINNFPNNTNLILRDLNKYIDIERVGIKGWDMKPMSLLFASGSEVLLLDADVMLFQAPEKFFMQSTYLETGALFFYDRIVPNKEFNPFQALSELQPHLSPMAQKIRSMLIDKTSYIQEAGAVVIDVQSHLAAVIAMASFTGEVSVKDALYEKIYGDKEIYFMAFETVGDNGYSFNQYYPGVLGNMLMSKGLCGRMLHFDDESNNGQPLWTNGGYEIGEDDIRTVKRPTRKKINPEFYVKGGSVTENHPNQHWTWMNECNGFALEHNLDLKYIGQTPVHQKAIIEKILSYA